MRYTLSLIGNLTFFSVLFVGARILLFAYSCLIPLFWFVTPARRLQFEQLYADLIETSKKMSILRFLNLDSIVLGAILRANTSIKSKKINNWCAEISEIQFIKIYDSDLIENLYRSHQLTDHQYSFLKNMGILIALKKALTALNNRG